MRFALMAWCGSVFSMVAALFFQYGLGLEPCVLCIYQRVPHILAIVLGAWAIWQIKYWVFPILGAAMIIGAGIAFFHAGVEQHWWEGLAACSGNTGLSVDDLLATPPARCDEIPWKFLGLSMAVWNGILSLGLGILWFMAWREE